MIQTIKNFDTMVREDGKPTLLRVVDEDNNVMEFKHNSLDFSSFKTKNLLIVQLKTVMQPSPVKNSHNRLSYFGVVYNINSGSVFLKEYVQESRKDFIDQIWHKKGFGYISANNERIINDYTFQLDDCIKVTLYKRT